MVGAKGFEPSTSWSRTSSRNTILLARLALFCVEQVRLGWYSAVNGLKSDSTFGLNPCCETKNRAHLAAFYSALLVSPSRRRGLGKRTAFESSSPAAL